MSVYLKVKGMTLAQEIRIIRRLEKKRRDHSRRQRERGSSPYQIVEAEYGALQRHRLELRALARISHIAYTFLRRIGETPFTAIEAKSFTAPQWGKIEAEIVRFAQRDARYDIREVMQRFSSWKEAAGEWSQPTGRVKTPREPLPPAKEIETRGGGLDFFVGTDICVVDVWSEAYTSGDEAAIARFPGLTKADIRAAYRRVYPS